jgi:hypothetical protein
MGKRNHWLCTGIWDASAFSGGLSVVSIM